MEAIQVAIWNYQERKEEQPVGQRYMFMGMIVACGLMKMQYEVKREQCNITDIFGGY